MLGDPGDILHVLAANALDIITLLDIDGTIRYQSPAITPVLGYASGDLIGQNVYHLIHPDDIRMTEQAHAHILASPGVPIAMHVRFRHRNGAWRTLDSRATNLLEDRRIQGLIVNSRDITEHLQLVERLRAAEARYRQMVEQLPAVTYVQSIDDPLTIEYVSPQVHRMFGCTPEECMTDPEHWVRLLHPDDRQRVVSSHALARERRSSLDVEYRNATPDGRVVWVRDQALVIEDEHGEPRFWHGVITDVSAQKLIEEQLAHQALHDALTGLPNRQLMLDRLDHALVRSRRSGKHFAVLFIDLDRFKEINDSLGHAAGDDVLRIVSQRLRSCIRAADTPARLSGDEFAVLIEDVASVEDVARVADALRECLVEPFWLSAHPNELLTINASIGIALSQDDTRNGNDVLSMADSAMYRAKRIDDSSTTVAFSSGD
jgi:diguanylate cyclase (GGDEF)-like protein/PAS domain S-box-containing protein